MRLSDIVMMTAVALVIAFAVSAMVFAFPRIRSGQTHTIVTLRECTTSGQILGVRTSATNSRNVLVEQRNGNIYLNGNLIHPLPERQE